MKNDEKFWHRWILSYSLSELFGIGAAAIIARFLYMGYSGMEAGKSPILDAAVLLIAGTCEGLIIGYVQWRSLSRVVGELKAAPWVLTTTLASIVGWFIILPPAILVVFFFARLSAAGQYTSVVYALLAGAAFGGLIGIAQFFIIRRFFYGALVWIFANAVSWALSFLILYFALFYFSGSLLSTLLIIVACLASGLAQGMVTGTSLHFLMVIKGEARSRRRTKPAHG